jgi:fatty acid/phospholipid biosynthesis enzyme
VICHGASRAKAIKNAVGLAERICNERVCEVIAAAVGDINTETLEQKMQIDAEG